MKTACAPACGTCEQISYEFRCPFDKNAPNALNPGDLDTMFERMLKDFPQYSPTILSSPNNDNDNNSNKGPWVIQLDTFATAEECERLIQLGADLGYGDSRTVGQTFADGTIESVVADRIRTSKNAWCEETCENDPIVVPLWDRIETLLEIPKNNSEFLQLLRYHETQFYGQHHDYLDHHKERPPVGTYLLQQVAVFLCLFFGRYGGV
jgi:prolyl 4-hydroxylase